MPVAMRMVISACGLPARTPASSWGIVMRLGTGRVWSLVMISTRRFPFASEASPGELMGDASARRTISSCASPEGAVWRGASTARSRPCGICAICFPLP